MKSLVIVALAATSASASPLGAAWTQKAKCEMSASVHGNASEVMWQDGNLKLLRRSRATGEALKAWKVQPRVDLVAVDDSFVILRDPKGFSILDAKTGKELWRHVGKIDYSEHAQEIVGANIATVRVGKAKSHELELDDGATGKALWKVTLPTTDYVHWLGAGTTLLFAVQGTTETSTITAYSLKDGSVAWTKAGVTTYATDIARAFGDELAVGGQHELHWFDAKGAMTDTKLELSTLGPITADRLFVTTELASKLVAVDRKTKKVAWTMARRGWDTMKLLSASATAVFATDAGELVEVDAKTGKVVTTFGLATSAISSISGGGFVGCEEAKRLFLLDPTAADVPVESATITGTITCPCGTPKMWVQIGAVKVPVADDGTFSIAIKSRGSVELVVAFTDQPTGSAGDATDAKLIALIGKHTYALGKLQVVQGSDGD